MANYSFNHIAARGSKRSLALLQAEAYAPLFGPSGDKHASSWETEDGLDVLIYQGCTRRIPPVLDVCELSRRHPECLLEMSFIDEGFCYEGFIVHKGGLVVMEGRVDAKLRDEIDGGEWDGRGGGLQEARQSHLGQMASGRALRGGAPGGSDPLFDSFMRALSRDEGLAWDLGAAAKVAPGQRTRLALLMAAPACLGEVALRAVVPLEGESGSSMLAASMWFKETPWGVVPGLRALTALHGAKAPGWIEKDWDPNGGGMRVLTGHVCAALSCGSWVGEPKALDVDRCKSGVAALFAAPDVDGLLFSVGGQKRLWEGAARPLGEAIVLAGCDHWRGATPIQKVAASRFEELARASGRSGWIDQLFMSLASCAPRLAGAFCESSVALDSAVDAALPSLSETTLAALMEAGLVGDAGRALIESKLLGSAAPSTPKKKSSMKL